MYRFALAATAALVCATRAPATGATITHTGNSAATVFADGAIWAAVDTPPGTALFATLPATTTFTFDDVTGELLVEDIAFYDAETSLLYNTGATTATLNMSQTNPGDWTGGPWAYHAWAGTAAAPRNGPGWFIGWVPAQRPTVSGRALDPAHPTYTTWALAQAWVTVPEPPAWWWLIALVLTARPADRGVCYALGRPNRTTFTDGKDTTTRTGPC